MIIKAENGSSFEIIPMTNIDDLSCITYDVSIYDGKNTVVLGENSQITKYDLPAGTFGKIMVRSYVDGKQHNSVKQNYASM